MSADQDLDTTRTAVKTYVPAYQKTAWEEHASALGMSQSEFVRSMVQAGRRGFEPAETEGGFEDATPGVDGLETGVLESLSAGEYMSWDELVSHLLEDFEDRLEETLQ